MKQILLLICTLFLVTSCEIQYDGETKIAVTGKIIDENGNPLSGKDIQILVQGDGGLFSAKSDLISFGESDQNGNFTLIFPTPQGEYNFSVSINNLQKQTSEFQAQEIIANKNNFENYKLDLDNITLYKNKSITTLQLHINRTTINTAINGIRIEGKQPNNVIDLNLMQNDPNYWEMTYSIIKNQTIVLKYNIIDYSNNGATTVQSISIPIANDAVNYTITY